MRTAIAFIALAASSPAFAGGLGIFGHGGVHTETVTYYSNVDADSGSPIPNQRDYPKFVETQVIPQFGGGLEFILGDRDDKITGVFRGFYAMETAQRDPSSTSEVAADSVVTAHRDTARHLGMASVGLNWGFIGNPEKSQVGMSAHFGAGVLTKDNSEFLQIAVGPTVNVRLNRGMIGFADAQYLLRSRKGIQHGANVIVGLRFMFD